MSSSTGHLPEAGKTSSYGENSTILWRLIQGLQSHCYLWLSIVLILSLHITVQIFGPVSLAVLRHPTREGEFMFIVLVYSLDCIQDCAENTESISKFCACTGLSREAISLFLFSQCKNRWKDGKRRSNFNYLFIYLLQKKITQILFATS